MDSTTLKTQKIVYRSKAEWLEKKQYLLTAQEAVAVLGCSSEMSALDVWMEKTGLEARSEVCEVVRLQGALFYLLPVATNPKCCITGWHSCRDDYEWWVHQHRYYQASGPLLLFYDPHTIPDLYYNSNFSMPHPQYIEFQYTLAAMDAERGTIGALVDGPEFIHHEVMRDNFFIDMITPPLETFWASVLSKTPPESDGSDACTEAIARLYNEPDASKCRLDPEIHRDLVEVKQRVKDAKSDETRLKNQIKMAIGNHSVGILPGGSYYSFNNVDVQGYTVDSRTTRRLVFHPVKGTK